MFDFDGDFLALLRVVRRYGLVAFGNGITLRGAVLFRTFFVNEVVVVDFVFVLLLEPRCLPRHLACQRFPSLLKRSLDQTAVFIFKGAQLHRFVLLTERLSQVVLV